MKKNISVFLTLLLLVGSVVFSQAMPKKKESDEPIVIKLVNSDFCSGRVYLTDTFSTPYYLGRISPGYITKLRIRAPHPSRTYALVVTSGGRVTHSVILESLLEPGDKIEWDLAYNLFSWEPMKSDKPKSDK